MDVHGRSAGGRREEVLRLVRDAREPVSIAEIAVRLGIHQNTARFHLDTLAEHGQVERAQPTRRSPGRPPLLFRAVRTMDPDGPRHYLLLAEVLADTLAGDPDVHARAIAAGRAWGHRHADTADHDERHAGNHGADPAGDSGDGPAEGHGGDPVGGHGGGSGGGHVDDVVREPAGDRRDGRAGEPLDRLVSLLDTLRFAPERGDRGRIGLRNCPFLELAAGRPQIVCSIHLGLMQGAMSAWGSPVTVDRLDPFVEPDLCVAHLTREGAR